MTTELLNGLLEEVEASVDPDQLEAQLVKLKELPDPPLTKPDLEFWLVCANRRLCQLQMAACKVRSRPDREVLGKRVGLLEAEVDTRRAMLRAVSNGEREQLDALLLVCAEQDIYRKNAELCALQQQLISSPRSRRTDLKSRIAVLDNSIVQLQRRLDSQREAQPVRQMKCQLMRVAVKGLVGTWLRGAIGSVLRDWQLQVVAHKALDRMRQIYLRRVLRPLMITAVREGLQRLVNVVALWRRQLAADCSWAGMREPVKMYEANQETSYQSKGGEGAVRPLQKSDRDTEAVLSMFDLEQGRGRQSAGAASSSEPRQLLTRKEGRQLLNSLRGSRDAGVIGTTEYKARKQKLFERLAPEDIVYQGAAADSKQNATSTSSYDACSRI